MGRLSTEQRQLAASAAAMVSRLVRSAARRWPELSLRELESIGNEAVVRAARVFDPSRGVPFDGYAYRRVQGDLRRLAAQDALGHRAAIAAVLRVDGDWSEDAAAGAVEATNDTPAEARSRALLWTRREAAALVAAALLSEGPPPPDEQIAAKQTRAQAFGALDAAIKRLSSQQQELVALHYRLGLSLAEIAARFGSSTRTVQRLHETVKGRLARVLAGAGVAEPPPLDRGVPSARP